MVFGIFGNDSLITLALSQSKYEVLSIRTGFREVIEVIKDWKTVNRVHDHQRTPAVVCSLLFFHF